MDKSLLISMFLSFATSNDILKYEPQNAPSVGIPGNKDTAGKWPPSFCNGIGCPKFNVLKTTEDYEIRKYVNSEWVSTSLSGVDYKEASSKMFWNLFRYIGGENSKSEKIDMTCPVTMRVIPSTGPACESNFTMSFFVAPEVGKPPAPTNDEVFLQSKSSFVVYVRQFGGFTNNFEETWGKQALALGAALDKDGLKYETKYYYTAGYDAPFKIFNRHNEVWFFKK